MKLPPTKIAYATNIAIIITIQLLKESAVLHIITVKTKIMTPSRQSLIACLIRSVMLSTLRDAALQGKFLLV